MRTLCFLLILAFAGCAEDSPAAYAPPVPNVTPPTPGTTVRRDGGQDAAAIDADGSVPTYCEDLDENPSNVILRQGAGELPFEEKGAQVFWDSARCGTEESLVFMLAESPICSFGSSYLLVIVDRRDLRSGLLQLNVPQAIRPGGPVDAVWIRPSDDTSSRVTMGTCTGADGLVTFEALSGDKGFVHRVRIDATLTDCSATPTQPPLAVVGTIEATLNNNYDEICP